MFCCCLSPTWERLTKGHSGFPPPTFLKERASRKAPNSWGPGCFGVPALLRIRCKRCTPRDTEFPRAPPPVDLALNWTPSLCLPKPLLFVELSSPNETATRCGMVAAPPLLPGSVLSCYVTVQPPPPHLLHRRLLVLWYCDTPCEAREVQDL